MNRENTPINPISVLTIVLVMTWAVLAGLGWSSYRSHHNARATTHRRLEIEELRGSISHLDEVLTMSARMAAFTGDPRWEERYRRFEPQLDAAIKETMRLAPEAYSGEAAAETDAANIKLVKMENRAFDLVRQGRTEEAKSLLLANEYESQKRVYAQGMTRFAKPKAHHLRLVELRGLIVHLDEVLTMSARSAAATGDLQWEDRYRRFEPQLEIAIKEAIALAPGVHSGRAAAETDAANIKLVEMENRAFDLVRQGHAEEARAVLFSDEYESQKRVYAKGMNAFAAGLADTVSTTLKREQQLSSLQTGAILLLMPLLMVGWLVVFRAVHHWKTTLAKQAGELAKMNASLDQKVVHRTESLQNEVAERKRAEEKLRREKELSDDIINSLPGLFYIFDEERFVRWNKRWETVTGYSAEELEKMYGPDFFEGADREHIVGRMQAVFHEGAAEAEAEIVAKDGRKIPFYFTGLRSIFDGKPYLVGLGIDITKRRQTDAELARARDKAEAANRAKSEFLANMSHEIRTPMTAILGFAEMLRSEGDLSKAPPKRVEAVDTIIRNGNHLLKVISDILDLSKVEAAKMTVESRECSPWHIVEEAVSSTQGSVEDKGLKLAVEHTFPLPRTIRTDPVRLKQVLINLIGNAVKFTEHGGVRINVRCVQQLGTAPPEKPGAVMQFVVTDTGIGMTEGQMGRVFQPFTQADTGHTRRFGGTGLGLAISKHLAVMLGGDIQVESEPDKGSTFTLTIDPGPMDGVPMLDAPPETSAKEEPTAPLQAIRGRVLLAEDGPDNQRVIAFLLEKAGAEVAVAENGQIAHDLALAARAEGNPFDVILMDMQMPVMDGYAATGKLREAGYTGPIIALTAHAMSTDRDRCLAAGCDDYLTKPIDRKALISTVAEYASAKELLKACDAPVA